MLWNLVLHTNMIEMYEVDIDIVYIMLDYI